MVRPPPGHEPAVGPWVYFVLTFAWSWLFWGVAIASGLPWTELPTAVLYITGGVGPSLVALALVHLGRGGESARDFWTRAGVARLSPHTALTASLVELPLSAGSLPARP